jgi:hypothetical protein
LKEREQLADKHDGEAVLGALRRALEIERSMVRLYERKLRALLTEQGSVRRQI